MLSYVGKQSAHAGVETNLDGLKDLCTHEEEEEETTNRRRWRYIYI